LDPILFFKCCLWEQRYGMNGHANRPKSRMEQITVTLCLLLQILLLQHDVIAGISVTPQCSYRLPMLHLGCRLQGCCYSVIVVTSQTLFDYRMLLQHSWQSVIGKSSVYAELLVPFRQVAILETNRLKLLSLSFMRSR